METQILSALIGAVTTGFAFSFHFGSRLTKIETEITWIKKILTERSA